jgi:hypothetical protein
VAFKGILLKLKRGKRQDISPKKLHDSDFICLNLQFKVNDTSSLLALLGMYDKICVFSYLAAKVDV